ncbi:MAG: S8 family serine peptidase [Clostridia bacterium]|nr:S8 family serine peptidase [Clostridia bacterium]
MADTQDTAILQESSDKLSFVADNIYKTDDPDYAALLLRCGQAIYVEPDYTATLCDLEDEAEICDGWPYEAMNVAYADSVGLDGSGVCIGVIDSGVDLLNPDLKNANICAGYDYVENTTQMKDDVYHGTKVMQMICGDKNELGVTGMARGAKIVPLRCFSATKNPNVSNLVKIIDDAVNVYGCDVINMSWSVDVKSAALYNAIERAYSAGVVLVAASGNVSSGAPQGTVLYPAAYEHVLGVSSVNKALSYVSSAQHTVAVDVCAPGAYITFTGADEESITSTGTSFAAPCVTAAAAVILQLAPDMDNADMLWLFKERAIDLGDEGYDNYYGCGFISFDKLIDTHWEKAVPLGDDSFMISSWIISPGGGYIMYASYNDDGKMTGLSVYEEKGDFGYKKKIVTNDVENEKTTLFYLDKNYAPISQSVEAVVE